MNTDGLVQPTKGRAPILPWMADIANRFYPSDGPDESCFLVNLRHNLSQAIADGYQQATQSLTCAYCGHEYPPGTPPSQAEALSAHIRVCAKHPMREVEAERDRLRAALRPFATYAEKRLAKPFSGLADEIHTIHTGTEWEASITFTDCKRALRALRS